MIGSCCMEDVAVRVLTRVIGHCPHRNQLLIDCGWAGIRWVQLHSVGANTYPLSSVFCFTHHCYHQCKLCFGTTM